VGNFGICCVLVSGTDLFESEVSDAPILDQPTQGSEVTLASQP
jgi:hypothetical protein